MASPISLKTKALVVACAAAIVVPFVPAPSEAHQFDTQSNITINRQGHRFFGKVASSRGICKRGRMVTLYRKRGGRRFVAGRDRTNRNGNWSIRARRRGRFHAVVSQKVRSRYRHNHVCRGDRSATIRKRRGGGH
jgi:hypothetical protein